MFAGSLGDHYESELDAKIRKIKEKNDQIMRRKRQIEEDKKKYGWQADWIWRKTVC